METWHGDNHVITHRKKAGLSQREVARLIGYAIASVSRHEAERTELTLSTALGYELVFGVPVAQLFPRLTGSIRKGIEQRINLFERELLEKSSRSDREAKRCAQKLAWIDERRAAFDRICDEDEGAKHPCTSSTL